MEPVVSSKYGKRPLLEVPAMQVESGSRLEISSLQPRPQPRFTDSPALVYRSSGLNQHHQPQAMVAPPQQPALPAPIQQPTVAAAALQQPAVAAHPGLAMRPGVGAVAPAAVPVAGPQVPGSLYAPPPGHLPYLPQQPLVPPVPLSHTQPQHFVDASGNLIPAANAYPVPMQPPQPFPGVHSAYPGGYYPPVAPQGVAPQYLLPAPPRSAMEDNFRLEGVLEYGRLTTVHFRDKTSNFRGLPEFLRRELQKSYGHFPATDIRIVAQAGEFHIYAHPRSEEDEFIDGGRGSGGASNTRMIGFNEVRGEPR